MAPKIANDVATALDKRAWSHQHPFVICIDNVYALSNSMEEAARKDATLLLPQPPQGGNANHSLILQSNLIFLVVGNVA